MISIILLAYGESRIWEEGQSCILSTSNYPLQIAQNSLSESEKLIMFVRLLIAHVSFTQLSVIIILFIQ